MTGRPELCVFFPAYIIENDSNRKKQKINKQKCGYYTLKYSIFALITKLATCWWNIRTLIQALYLIQLIKPERLVKDHQNILVVARAADLEAGKTSQ